MLADDVYGFATIGCLADHADVGLRVEDHPEAAADECLVVGDDDADHGLAPSVGSRAITRKRPSGAMPASSEPPYISARSRMPVNPYPDPTAPLTRPSFSISSASSSASSATRTRVRSPGACLMTF